MPYSLQGRLGSGSIGCLEVARKAGLDLQPTPLGIWPPGRTMSSASISAGASGYRSSAFHASASTARVLEGSVATHSTSLEITRSLA